MADTTFVDQTTVIVAAWLQDVNDLVYKAFASGADASSVTVTAQLTQKSSDSGDTIGPILKLHRDSVSPAPADFIGALYFDGEDGGSTQTTYASLEAQIDDITDTTEDGTLLIKTMQAGTLTTAIDISTVIVVTPATTFSGAVTHTGAVIVDDTTASTSGTTGSIQTDGGIGAAKDIVTAETFKPLGDTAAGDAAAIGYTATEGLILTGQGSTYDVVVKNDADALVMSVATGTTAATFAGDVTMSGSNPVFLHGTSSARAVGTTTPNILSEYASDISNLALVYNVNDATSGGITIAKTRGAAVGGTTIVQDNDNIGFITFAAADGTDLVSQVARIYARIDGTPGADDTPGELIFATTQDGAATVTTALTLSSSQDATFAGNVTLTEGQAVITDTANEIALDINSSATTASGMTLDVPTNNYALQVTNSHATDPEGIRVDFSVATGSTSDRFFVGEDAGGIKAQIFGDGSATFAGAVTVSDSSNTSISTAGDILLNNAKAIRMKDSVGSAVSVLRVDSSNITSFREAGGGFDWELAAATSIMTLSTAGLLTLTGRLVTDDTTDSTSTTTGSIQTDGGLGVAKGMYLGTALNMMTNNSGIIGRSTGGSVFPLIKANASNVLEVGSSSFVSLFPGRLTVDDTTDSTSTTTGTIQTDGGLGVAKDAVIGTGLSVGGNPVDRFQTLFTGTFTSGGSSNLAALVHTTGTVVGEALDSEGVFGVHFTTATTTNGNANDVAELRLDEPDITVSAGTVTNASTLLITGAPTEGSNNYALLIDAGQLHNGDTTDSTSTTTGAITTSGGLGLAKNLVVGDGIYAGVGQVDYVQHYLTGTHVSGGASNSTGILRVGGTLTAASGDILIGQVLVMPTTTTTQGATEVVTEVASLSINEPNLVIGTGDTVASAATLLVRNAPTEASANYAVLVNSGRVHNADTTDSTSTSTGAITTSGGLGVVKDAVIGTGLTVGGTPVDYIQSLFGGTFTSGGASTSGVMVQLSGTLVNHSGDTSNSAALRITTDITNMVTTTINDIASVYIDEPNITNTGGGTITNAVSLLITGEPTEGTNNYAILVDSGRTNFGFTPESGIYQHAFGGTLTSDGSSTVAAGNYHNVTVVGHSGDSTGVFGTLLTGTHSINGNADDVAQLRIDEPTITETAGNVTNASTLLITGAPTEGTNNYAILVDSGDTKLGGNLNVNGETDNVHSVVIGTEQASTSGTAIDFTSIPSWVKRITINYQNVGTNGTDVVIVQLGDSGGIETSSYTQSCTEPGVGSSSTTAGFAIDTGGAIQRSGTLILSLQKSSTNSWSSMCITSKVGCMFGAGYKALSDTLTQVRITTISGTDTFDSGSINILYE